MKVTPMSWHEKTWAKRYALYGPSGRKGEQQRRVPPAPVANKEIDAKPIPPVSEADRERFFQSVHKTNGCWLWTGPVAYGYGSFTLAGRTFRAHRVSYILAGRDLPVGLVVDHLCREKQCVNPAHLEAVTSGENTRRGHSYPSHCKRGHELSGENVRMVGKQRKCRLCQRIRTAKWRARQNG
jgi:hypothetical protein